MLISVHERHVLFNQFYFFYLEAVSMKAAACLSWDIQLVGPLSGMCQAAENLTVPWPGRRGKLEP